MTIRNLLAILFLALSSTSYAGNTPNGASSLEQVGTWMGDQLGSYISSGCLPTVPASSMTLAPLACRGAVRISTGALRYVSQAAVPITLTGANGRFFLALHSDQQTAVTGWTRTAGSHYLWQRFTGTNVQLPAAPANTQLVAEMTVAGGVVTAVTDRRRPASLASSGVCELTDPLFGAVGDGTADDTAALQAALANYACPTVSGKGGDQYRFTAPLSVTRALRFTGQGAGPGGATTVDSRYQGVALNHDFNGNALNIVGILNDVIGTVGLELDNFILRQVFGTGTTRAGNGLNIIATSNNERASWLKIHNVNIEQKSGADHWAYDIYVDGSTSLDIGGGLGSRDLMFENMRVVTGSQSFGAIYLKTVVSGWFRNIQIEGDASTNTFVITGADSSTRSSRFKGFAVQSTGFIQFDHAEFNQCWGCSAGQVEMTANAVGNDFWGSVSGLPTLGVGGVANRVYSAGRLYHSGTEAPTWGVYQIDSNPTHLRIDTPTGTASFLDFYEQSAPGFALSKAADGSLGLTHETAGLIWTVTTTGAYRTVRGTARAGFAPTYGAAVTVDCTKGDIFQIDVTDGTAFTITPSNQQVNQILTIMIRNMSGGAMGAVTWDAGTVNLAGAFVAPATGFQRSITFRGSGTKLFELSRTAADVAN